MHVPTHVVFSKPKIIDGVFHRGFVVTDNPNTIDDQLERSLWAIGLMFHAPIRPYANSNIDLYLCTPTYKDCPEPRVAVTDRDLTCENTYYPLPEAIKQYDVIFNMNWEPFKRHELLIETLAYAKQVGRTISCLWFGYHYRKESQARETHIRNLVQQAGVDDVTFAETSFDTAEVNSRINASRVSVICSTGEGGPRVLPESLLAGVPAVVTRDTDGGVPEVICGQTGLVCEPTGKAIAEAIWDVIDRADQFSPRQWALENMCLSRTMPRLREAVTRLSQASAVPINLQLAFEGYDWVSQNNVVRCIEKALAKGTRV
jgi:glycosyltransferase involved in cell wall biosynthesis